MEGSAAFPLAEERIAGKTLFIEKLSPVHLARIKTSPLVGESLCQSPYLDGKLYAVSTGP
jgi:hypothetical protein